MTATKQKSMVSDWVKERYSKPMNIIVKSKPKYTYKGHPCEIVSTGQDREVFVKISIGNNIGKVLGVDESEITTQC